MVCWPHRYSMANVLIVYCQVSYPPRATVAEQLYCFARYAGARHRCFYLNLAVRDVPRYLLEVPFDMVIFHTTFFAWRWGIGEYRQVLQKARALKRLRAVRAMVPQDEFYRTDALNEFIDEFEVGIVYTVSPRSEWSKLYPAAEVSGVRLVPVLTGYLDDATVGRIDALTAARAPRETAVGYRAWRANPWLGRYGFLKTRVADVFAQRAPAFGLATDISTRAADTFYGDEWYRFLLRCRYVIGVQGGAGVLDWDGSVRECAEALRDERPDAGFEEIEAACFPGKDGGLAYFAISPRHLEACATRTCQVLIEGHYNGVLTPGLHYIELKQDFSNLDDVLQRMASDRERETIVARAYDDVVRSRAYSYRGFVDVVLAPVAQIAAPRDARVDELWARARRDDQRALRRTMLNSYVLFPAKRLARATLPAPVLESLRRLRHIPVAG
jgi:hypothetical protein